MNMDREMKVTLSSHVDSVAQLWCEVYEDAGVEQDDSLDAEVVVDYIDEFKKALLDLYPGAEIDVDDTFDFNQECGYFDCDYEEGDEEMDDIYLAQDEALAVCRELVAKRIEGGA